MRNMQFIFNQDRVKQRKATMVDIELDAEAQEEEVAVEMSSFMDDDY